jgi:hypothetical protein
MIAEIKTDLYKINNGEDVIFSNFSAGFQHTIFIGGKLFK